MPTLPPDVLKSVRDQIKAANDKLPQVEAALNEARLAGVDVSQQTAQHQANKIALQKLQGQYGSS